MKLKTILIAFLAIASTLSISCSKDKDDKPKESKENLILGTWEVTKEEEKGTREITTGNKTETEIIDGTYYPKEGEYDHLTFEKNGTFKSENQKLEITTGTYKVSDNKLIFPEREKPNEYTIKVTKNELAISLYEERPGTNSDGTSTYLTKRTSTTTYKRIK